MNLVDKGEKMRMKFANIIFDRKERLTIGDDM